MNGGIMAATENAMGFKLLVRQAARRARLEPTIIKTIEIPVGHMLFQYS